MKLIIDIDKEVLNKLPEAELGSNVIEDVLEAVENGTPLDDIKAEIDRQEKWLSQAGYTPYNVDIAFDSIKAVMKGANNG